MRRIRSLCLALVIVLALTGCVWAATNGILTAIDSSGKVLGERFSVPEDTAVEFVVSWDAAVAENIDCIFFVRSNDNYCVSGPCWSADQSPNYGWHHGGGNGNGGGHGGHHSSGHGDAWHHRQHVSHDVFCPASGDHCIIAKGYGNSVQCDANGNPIGNPIGVSTPVYMTVTSTSGGDPGDPSDPGSSGTPGNPGSGGGGGGCMAGFLGMALLVVVPMFIKRS